MKDVRPRTLEARSTKSQSNQVWIAAFERTTPAIDVSQLALGEEQVVGVYSGFSVVLPGGEHYESTAGVSGKGGNQMDHTYRRDPQRER